MRLGAATRRWRPRTHTLDLSPARRPRTPENSRHPPLVHGKLIEQLGDIAGAEDLVNIGEFVRLVRREIGRKHTFRRALAPEEFACGTR